MVASRAATTAAMSAAILACNNDSCAALEKTCDQAAAVDFPCRKCELLEDLREVRSSLDEPNTH